MSTRSNSRATPKTQVTADAVSTTATENSAPSTSRRSQASARLMSKTTTRTKAKTKTAKAPADLGSAGPARRGKPTPLVPWWSPGVDRPGPSTPILASSSGSETPSRGLATVNPERPDMYHCGMDLHSGVAVFHLIDGSGRIVAHGNLPATEAELGAMARGIRKHTRFYVEASTSSAWFNRLIEACGHQVVVVAPNRLRAISNSPSKTDARDAEVLAMLGKTGLLSKVYVRSETTDRFRRPFTARHALVKARASLIRTTRSLLRSEGHNLPSCDGDDFARRLGGTWGIPDGYEQSLPSLIEAIDSTTTQILDIEAQIDAVAAAEPETVRRLTQVPGVGKLVATSFLALIEDPRRFRKSSEDAAYLGLAPWVNSSAGKRKPGGITKLGNRATRSLLVQAAWSHLRSTKDTALKRWYYKLADRIGRKKAIEALARKLGELLWTLWRMQADYQPFPPTSRRAPAPT